MYGTSCLPIARISEYQSFIFSGGYVIPSEIKEKWSSKLNVFLRYAKNKIENWFSHYDLQLVYIGVCGPEECDHVQAIN